MARVLYLKPTVRDVEFTRPDNPYLSTYGQDEIILPANNSSELDDALAKSKETILGPKRRLELRSKEDVANYMSDVRRAVQIEEQFAKETQAERAQVDSLTNRRTAIMEETDQMIRDLGHMPDERDYTKIHKVYQQYTFDMRSDDWGRKKWQWGPAPRGSGPAAKVKMTKQLDGSWTPVSREEAMGIDYGGDSYWKVKEGYRDNTRWNSRDDDNYWNYRHRGQRRRAQYEKFNRGYREYEVFEEKEFNDALTAYSDNITNILGQRSSRLGVIDKFSDQVLANLEQAAEERKAKSEANKAGSAAASKRQTLLAQNLNRTAFNQRSNPYTGTRTRNAIKPAQPKQTMLRGS